MVFWQLFTKKRRLAGVFIDVESLVGEVVEHIEGHICASVFCISYADGEGISEVQVILYQSFFDLLAEALDVRLAASLVDSGELVTAESGEEEAGMP